MNDRVPEVTSNFQEAGPNMLEAALEHGRHGHAVFPLHTPDDKGKCSCGGACKSPGKHPRTRDGFKAATTDEIRIRTWWTAWPDANIGIATGAVSGFIVVDVDGIEGEASLQRLVDENGPLPGTHTVKTGKGRQLYFRHPGGKVRNAAPIRRDFPGLDSRGDGGYVVAPPSLHHNLRRYVLDEASATEIVEAPAWLIAFINDRPSNAGGALRLVVDNDRPGIADGSRNSTLTSMAGSMRARGLGQAAIEAALLAHNAEECQPPLDEDEVRAIARSVSRYAPGSPSDVLRTLNDVGNAERFAKQWGDGVRYVPELKRWLVWDNSRQWQADASGAVMEMAKQTASDIYREGDHINNSDLRKAIAKHSTKSQQAPRLEAMLKLAQSIPELVAPIATLDADPWMLAVENGTLDLRKGTLQPPRREDYITRVAPAVFDADAECPTFLRFLQQIMGGDQDLIDYLQRIMDYMLTGDTREQRLFFLYGTGANGKSTLLNVFKSILGPELCRQTPSETIMARTRQSGPTPELACLHGARAVMTTEVDEGSFLSEALVKQMTGGDPISARHLYGSPFDFAPWFKLFVAGNHKPTIRGSDEGIWRRIDLIPFKVTIPPEQRDWLLADRLRAELPGILKWALVGCSVWQEQGLTRPAAVVNAVADYREDMDVLGQWISQLCELGPELELPASLAYESYHMWALAAGFRAWSNTSFGGRMQERFDRKRTAKGNVYYGVALRRSTGVISVPKANVSPPRGPFGPEDQGAAPGRVGSCRGFEGFFRTLP